MQVLVAPEGEGLAPEDRTLDDTLGIWPGDGVPRRWPPTCALEPFRIKEFVYRFDPEGAPPGD